MRKIFLFLSLFCLTASGFSSDYSNDPYIQGIKTAIKKAYKKGIEDTYEFLRYQSVAPIPEAGYWLMKDVSGQPLPKIEAFVIYGKGKGFSPVVLVAKGSGRTYVVFGSFGSETSAREAAKKLQPVKTFVAKVSTPQAFARYIVPYTQRNCPKVENNLKGAIELLQSAESILYQYQNPLFDNKKAVRDLRAIIEKLEEYKQKLEKAQQYIESGGTEVLEEEEVN